MKLDEDTNQNIGDDESEGDSEDTRESTMTSDIEEDDLDYVKEFLLLHQTHRGKSL